MRSAWRARRQRQALADAGIEADELSLVICSTNTPLMISPSTACQVLHRLGVTADVAAYDLQAACSGYLYALTAGWDFLQGHPDGNVLVLTTEAMRRIVDVDDPDTSPIFADAATATVLTTNASGHDLLAVLHRPVVSAHGDDGSSLRVPLPEPGAYVHMDGKKVFAEAVRRMNSMLVQACAKSGLTVGDLDLVVPHQANGRIIEAMRARLKLPRNGCGTKSAGRETRRRVRSRWRSTPCCVTGGAVKRIGLCAFGAGYTFGGAILSRVSAKDGSFDSPFERQ
jgi:3-oxoacyl-(acyl-carrier-protein) synthase III